MAATKTYQINSYNVDFLCTQSKPEVVQVYKVMRDVIRDDNGLKVEMTEPNRLVGQIEGVTIPDIDSDEIDIEVFEIMMSDWLEKNFW